MQNLPKILKTKEDLDKALGFYYSQEYQSSELKHLRFGQFIFNSYTIEWKNSYNEKDPSKSYNLLSELLVKLQNYNEILDAIQNDQKIFPKELHNV